MSQPQAVVHSALAKNTFLQSLYTEEFLETVDRWSGVPGPPSVENRKKREGIQVLNNPFLERYLSKAHPSSPIVMATPLILWGGYQAVTHGHTVGLIAALFFGGILGWSLLEYLLHRFLFHFKPKDPIGKLTWFMLHGYHHEFPDDKMRLVAPPFMFWSLGLGVGFLFYFIFGHDKWGIVLAGTSVGYMAYDWIHYYTHHFHPKSGVGSWLRRYHLRHHFQDESMRYGISNPLWDLVFRTYRSPDAKN